MKLVYPTLQTQIILSNEYISTLVIEEPGFFYEIIRDLKCQLDGGEGRAVLSMSDKTVEIGRNMELIVDYIDFEINQRQLLTKVLSALDKTGKSEDYAEKSRRLIAEIEKYVFDLSFGFDIELECDKISIAQILKAAGIRIISDYDKLTEILYSYMQLVREFDNEKVFVFVNLRSFVKIEELQLFADTVLSHGYRVLLIDNFGYPSLSVEKRLIVDKDLCEI